jgi:hypothetical protein
MNDHHQASTRLHALRDEAASGSVDLGALSDRLGHAATGTLLLLCGVAGLVPGVAVVLSVPLCLLALGLILGHPRPWLPGGLRARRISGDRLTDAIDRVLPRLHWLEQRLRPRIRWAVDGQARRLIGFAALICGVLILLPVPFGNTAPALAVILLAVGLLARDGLAVVAGLGFTAGALAIDTLLLIAGYEAIMGISSMFA